MLKRIIIPFTVISISILLIFAFFRDFESYGINLLEQAKRNLAYYSSVSTLLLISDIILPIPSSIVMYMNGYILGALIGALVSFVSLIISSIIGYYLGKLGTNRKSIDENGQLILKNYGAWAIIITRGIPILSETICIICGYNRFNFRQYLVLNIIGYIPLCIIYAVVGSMGYDQRSFIALFFLSSLISASFWLLGRNLILRQNVNR